MDCVACGFENPAGMRFCGGCGDSLPAGCPQCGSQNPVGFGFCGHCGSSLAGNDPAAISPPPERAPLDYTPRHLAERILRQRDALEGERKHVTVLFADIKGSMDIAQQVDPEQWHRILDGFFRILSEGIHRFEGTVNQYTGDGVMALFGAPIAHEDHAQRACFAALRLRSAIDEYADELRRQGHNFAVRIGINSGEVIVGRIGDDLRMDYTAQGHSVGLAARVQNLTAPGRVCISEETARLVDGYFELRDLGKAEVRGVDHPVGLFELVEVGELRTRLERSRARGFTSFVGRDDELQMLERSLKRAEAGERQVVGVVGEAGIGKSRLCAEFVERTRARGIPVYAAHCPPHGKSLSGIGSRELIQSFFGVTEYDAPDEARRKIAGTLVLLDPDFQEMLPLVFQDCGVPDPERPAPTLDAAVRRKQTVAFLRALVKARSARECALFLLDDLHWADPETDRFISNIVETAAGTRTMVLCNFRPEYEASWMDSSDYLRIPLRALTAADSARLVDTLLGDDPSLAPLRARILERAGGNPFFAEELVQSMLEAQVLEGERGACRLLGDAAEIAVPQTVHAVLAARIDRLGEKDKELLQAAAVVGREFSEEVLAQVSGFGASQIATSLATLRSSDFVVEEAIYPEILYAFKHPLTHEVAYRTQLATRRATLHAATAQALGERGGDPELIAQHHEEAGEAMAAARRYVEAAGELAHRAPDSASRSWRKVRSLCAPLAEPEARELHEMAISQILLAGWSMGIDTGDAAELHREGMTLAGARGDVRAQVILLGIYSFIRLFRENAAAQLETLVEAAQLVSGVDDFELYAMVQQRLGWAYLTVGDLERCLEVSDAALARCGPDRARAGSLAGYGSQLFLLAQRAYAWALMGHLDEGEDELHEARRLAVEDGDDLTLISILGYESHIAMLSGDLGKAESAARIGVETSKGVSSTFRAIPLIKLATVLAEQNRGEELLRVANMIEELIPDDAGFGYAAVNLRAFGYAQEGRFEDARIQLDLRPRDELSAHFEQHGAFVNPDELYGMIRGLRSQRLVLAEAALERCGTELTLIQRLIDATGMTIFQPELDIQRGELARSAGDEETWRALLTSARGVFESDGRERRVAEIDAALAQ